MSHHSIASKAQATLAFFAQAGRAQDKTKLRHVVATEDERLDGTGPNENKHESTDKTGWLCMQGRSQGGW